MEQQNKLQEFESPLRRPLSFTVICVLSFIGSGMSAVSNMFLFLFHESVIEIIQSDVYKDMGLDMSMIQGVGKSYFLWSGITQLISLTGVRFMWGLRKKGFHFYTIAQMVLLILSSLYIYGPAKMFPGFDLLFTGSFVLIYYRFLVLMK